MNSTYRARLLALVLGLGWVPPLLAQSFPFDGRWVLDDTPGAPPAGYTTLTVKGTSLTWSGPDKATPRCVQQFVQLPEKPGTMYVNGRGTKFIAGVKGSLPTYLLKIQASSCGGLADAMRISYYLVYDVRHIEIIEYAQGKPVGSRRFHRRK